MMSTCPVCGYSQATSLGKRSDFYHVDQLWTDPIEHVEDVELLIDKEIHKCQVCGFQFVHPPYGDRELNALYNSDGYSHFNDVVYPIQELESPQAKQLLLSWRNKYVELGALAWKEVFARTHDRKPRMLDVGCGRGQHLIVFDELGFDVRGIDISRMQIQWIRDRLGYDVRQTTVEETDPSELFDCIVVAHVIEHVKDPYELMSHLVRRLHPGGLVMIETPIVWDRGIPEHRYRDMYHTMFFDHFTLTLLAARCGMRLRDCMNVLDRNDLRYEIFFLGSFAAEEGLRTDPLPKAHIQTLRAAHDGMFKDFCAWGRYYLQHERTMHASLARRAWNYYRSHGASATVRESLRYLERRVRSEPW